MFLDRTAYIFLIVIVVVSLFLGYSMGHDSGKREMMHEALDVGTAELIENYQTMNYEFRWIVIDEPRGN